MTAPTLTPYPFAPDDPPTVEDFETALGVLAHASNARQALAAGMPGSYYSPGDDPLAAATRLLHRLAPWLAVPNEDDRAVVPVTAPDEDPEPEEDDAA